jgi:hypothetical protein
MHAYEKQKFRINLTMADDTLVVWDFPCFPGTAEGSLGLSLYPSNDLIVVMVLLLS